MVVSGGAKRLTYNTLDPFSGTSGTFLGSGPRGSLVLGGSTLDGICSDGGAYGDGNIFSVNTDGSGFKNLLSFNGVNGWTPEWDFGARPQRFNPVWDDRKLRRERLRHDFQHQHRRRRLQKLALVQWHQR